MWRCFHESSPGLLCCSQLQLSIICIPVSNPEKFMGPSSWAWMESSFAIIVLSPRKKNVTKSVQYTKAAYSESTKGWQGSMGPALTWFLITALLGMSFLKWVQGHESLSYSQVKNPLPFLPIQWICDAQPGWQSPKPDSMLLNWDQYVSAESSI